MYAYGATLFPMPSSAPMYAGFRLEVLTRVLTSSHSSNYTTQSGNVSSVVNMAHQSRYANAKSISPPPLKRRKRDEDPPLRGQTTSTNLPFTDANSANTGSLRIFSWNVNGITPFVQSYVQTSIENFFKPSAKSSSPTTGQKRRRTGSGDETDDSEEEQVTHLAGKPGAEDLSKEGKASLRLALKRFGWPQILFLQEIKIKLGDEKTIGAVRQAINDGNVSPAESGRANDTKVSNSIRSDTEGEGSLTYLADGGPEYEVRFNLPADPYNAKGFGGKVYGVAAIIRKDFMAHHVQQIRNVSWDREGRVQIIETRSISFPLNLDKPQQQVMNADNPNGTSQESFMFAIINIYAVNGTSNPYRSTHTGAEVGTRHDRKLAVHTELLREAISLESQGFQVIIAGDLNVAISELDGYPNLRTKPYQHVLNRNDFKNKFFTANSIDTTSPKAAYFKGTQSDTNDILRGFDGLDTFRHVHGDEQRYSYHPRGVLWGSSCDRVDLVVGSRSLSRNIIDAGICDSPRDRGPSDHCPIWVEVGPGKT
ncbi:hypothetical protein JX265_006390 [Neoarthrinium moseri]|uniref:DNase I-like protein n=1 Tax=Neoarthrinium moseri TaxID=1658444 RepID=A0A9P9WMC8_9PEZI|nr:hypothetical protein JX265_006390 [Neoarthrinium moseri]